VVHSKRILAKIERGRMKLWTILALALCTFLISATHIPKYISLQATRNVTQRYLSQRTQRHVRQIRNQLAERNAQLAKQNNLLIKLSKQNDQFMHNQKMNTELLDMIKAGTGIMTVTSAITCATSIYRITHHN